MPISLENAHTYRSDGVLWTDFSAWMLSKVECSSEKLFRGEIPHSSCVVRQIINEI